MAEASYERGGLSDSAMMPERARSLKHPPRLMWDGICQAVSLYVMADLTPSIIIHLGSIVSEGMEQIIMQSKMPGYYWIILMEV